MRFVDDYRRTFKSHRSEYMFKALAMDKCIQANKRIMVRTEDWGTTTFKKWKKKKNSCQRIRRCSGDFQILHTAVLFPNKVMF